MLVIYMAIINVTLITLNWWKTDKHEVSASLYKQNDIFKIASVLHSKDESSFWIYLISRNKKVQTHQRIEWSTSNRFHKK